MGAGVLIWGLTTKTKLPTSKQGWSNRSSWCVAGVRDRRGRRSLLPRPRMARAPRVPQPRRHLPIPSRPPLPIPAPRAPRPRTPRVPRSLTPRALRSLTPRAPRSLTPRMQRSLTPPSSRPRIPPPGFSPSGRFRPDYRCWSILSPRGTPRSIRFVSRRDRISFEWWSPIRGASIPRSTRCKSRFTGARRSPCSSTFDLRFSCDRLPSPPRCSSPRACSRPPDSLLGETPLRVRPSVIEPVRLRFARPGYADTTLFGASFLGDSAAVSGVRLRSGPSLALPPASEAAGAPIYRKGWFQWTLIGIGAALSGAAIVFHHQGDQAYDEYLRSSNVSEIPGLYDDAVRYDRWAAVSLGVGQAALLVGGFVLLVTGQR